MSADVNPATTASDANHSTIHFCMMSSVLFQITASPGLRLDDFASLRVTREKCGDSVGIQQGSRREFQSGWFLPGKEKRARKPSPFYQRH
jgi:hypothetical protein